MEKDMKSPEDEGGGMDKSHIQERVDDSREFDNSLKLDSVLINQFENAFGEDLTRVSIHTGIYADALAKKHGANAVTIGDDIYFAHGKYAPHTEEGLSLLAHEIQHVIQNRNRDRLAYYEDIEKAEHEASRVEEIISNNRLHDIGAPILNQSQLPNISPMQSISKSDVPLNRTTHNKKDNLDDFISVSKKPVYEILLNDGTRLNLTRAEMEILYRNFERKVAKYLENLEKKDSEENVSEKIIKLMKII
jgi:hypothetical protein